MRKALIFALTLVVIYTAKATEKFQISFTIAPSFETLNFRNEKGPKGIHGWKFSYNFGAEYKHFLTPHFSVSSGIVFHNKGLENTLYFYKDSLAEVMNTPSDSGSLYVNANYLGAPLNLNLHIKLAEKTRLLATVGFTFAGLVNQNLFGSRFPEDADPNNPDSYIAATSFSSREPTAEGQPIYIFDKAFVGMNFGLGFSQYFKSKFVLVIQPMYSIQLNNAADPYGQARAERYYDPALDSFTINLSIGYYFTDQIEFKRKEL